MAKVDETKPWVYDLFLWTFSILVDLFFREIHPRSSWKVPKTGPVIFVAAPHANQFVDPLILMRLLRVEAHRRISYLIAEKSLKRKFIGWAARTVGSVGVGRALDTVKKVPGTIYLPDPENDPTLIRGIGTNFEGPDVQVRGLIVLPSVNNESANAEIAEILGPEELRLKKPFKGKVATRQLTGRKLKNKNGATVNGDVEKQIQEGRDQDGTTFKVAPHVDQTQVYDAVFEKLSQGGAIGIFPEGGSHDRTELLPLKAGVAIMALGAVAADPTCGLKIVPVGMNYFNAHKFRSRAVVEFGTPLDVPPQLVELYKSGNRREAVSAMLETIYDALVAVTVTSPDFDTLMLIQAVRRLYNPQSKQLPLPMVVELNRRLVKGYTRYRDDPRIMSLKKGVMSYHKQLMALNVRDHQLEYAKLSIIQVVAALFYRLGKLLILSAAVLPGLVLFAPVFIAGKVISIRKAREALAASTVKIQAKDVVATWKILVALALAPTLNIYYTVLLSFWAYYNRIQGQVPAWVPLWMVAVAGFITFPACCFAALRFGEIGMDIAKSLRPLVLSLNPTSGNTLVRLRVKRAALAAEVTDLINTLGPEMFADFDVQRIISPTEANGAHSPTQSRGRSFADYIYPRSGDSTPSGEHSTTAKASIGGGSTFHGHLPRNESFHNLGSFGLFSSRPQTPNPAHSRNSSRSHSRSASAGGGFLGGMGLQGFSPLDSKGALDDVSRKIRGAMRERSHRRSVEEHIPDEDSDSGPGTPALTMKKKV